MSDDSVSEPGGQAMRRRGWWVGLGATSLVVVLASLPPFVGPGAREALMHGFASFCHQMPGRSPHIDGVALAVCHRCIGIYWGLVVGVLAYSWLRRWDALLYRQAPRFLAASLAPLGLDWGLDFIGLWSNTPVTRAATGLLFGLAAGYYLTRSLVQLFDGAPRSDQRPRHAALRASHPTD